MVSHIVRQPTRLPSPWDSPGKNTGVGCHSLLQCMKVKSESKSLSHVQLLVTPWTVAHQAPPSMGFSRREYLSGCHRLLQCVKMKSESEVAQSCLTPSDPMDCSPPGSSVYGIFQAGVLELGAIAFSKILVVKYIQRFISHLPPFHFTLKTFFVIFLNHSSSQVFPCLKLQ